MRLWGLTDSLPRWVPRLSGWKPSLLPVSLKSGHISARQFCKMRVRNAVNSQVWISCERTDNVTRMTSYSCTRRSRSCTGLRLSSSNLSWLRIWILHWSKALLMSSSSSESCAAFGSSLRLCAETGDDQQSLTKLRRFLQCNRIVFLGVFLCYFFLPVLLTLTTSAAGFFKDAISADRLFFSSLNSLSKLNTENVVRRCDLELQRHRHINCCQKSIKQHGNKDFMFER